MEITGRVTAKAEVRKTKGDKTVTSFTIAMNESYRKKDGERVELTTYIECDYWFNSGVAEYLKKGTIVELSGRLDASAWIDKNGNARPTLMFHTRNIKLLGQSGNGATDRADIKAGKAEVVYSDIKPGADDDDLPF